jgi:hypothetical protein
MAELNISYMDYLQKWQSNNTPEEVIINELRQFGLQEVQISELLQQYKKKKNDERQQIGFIITAIGAFFGFLSCIFTMLDVFPDFRGFVLYGLTSIGIVLIFIGLFLVFE